MLVVVALLRAGNAAANAGARARWSLGLGVGLAMTIGSGPAALNGLLALAIGIAISLFLGGEGNPIHSSFAALASSGRNWLAATIGLLATILVLFTRLFTDLSALDGLLKTIADWARLIGSSSINIPAQLFVLSILL